MSTTLTSIAELSNVFSIIIVFAVFIVMVIFIIRLRSDDFRMSNTSVTFFQQMPVQQTQMIQILNPFILKLTKTEFTSAHTYDVTVSISSQCPFILHMMWGVTITAFHLQLTKTWDKMKEQILSKTFISSGTVHQESMHFDSACTAQEVCFSSPSSYQSSQLGISPRTKYPLIIILLRNEDQTDIHELGAMINIIHIRDEQFTLPSYVMVQYLKMADGQVTTLKPLYVVSNDEGNADAANETVAERQSPDTLCVVCQTEVVTRALLPCRHVCTCQGCFSRLDKCPMCRSRIESYFCTRDETVSPLNTDVNDAERPGGWRLWREWMTQLLN
ncbi:hypothetical protein CHUAL_002913 [Chamberlinius hualienensis]